MSFPKLNSCTRCGLGKDGWPVDHSTEQGAFWHLALLHGCTEHKCLKKGRKERGKEIPLLRKPKPHSTQTEQKGQVFFTHCLALWHTVLSKEKKERGDFSDESSDVTGK